MRTGAELMTPKPQELLFFLPLIFQGDLFPHTRKHPKTICELAQRRTKCDHQRPEKCEEELFVSYFYEYFRGKIR